jgi:hypothetical protein
MVLLRRILDRRIVTLDAEQYGAVLPGGSLQRQRHALDGATDRVRIAVNLVARHEQDGVLGLAAHFHVLELLESTIATAGGHGERVVLAGLRAGQHEVRAFDVGEQ